MSAPARNLYFPPTATTPEVSLALATQQLSLRGESYPENPASFYGPLLVNLEQYFSQGDTTPFTLTIDLSYFNSSSTKALFRLLALCEKAARAGRTIHVQWHYDLEDDGLHEFISDIHADFPVLIVTAVALCHDARL